MRRSSLDAYNPDLAPQPFEVEAVEDVPPSSTAQHPLAEYWTPPPSDVYHSPDALPTVSEGNFFPQNDYDLIAPAPRFREDGRSSRPVSCAGSTSSLTRGRVELGRPRHEFGKMDCHASVTGVNALAQEELNDEAEGDSGKLLANPYSRERPLDTVNRLSRVWDATPAPMTAVDRRASRLPPGVLLLDPFGMAVSSEVSPYDSALQYSASPYTQSRSRASFYPSPTSISLGASNSYQSSSGLSAMSASSGSYPSSSAATSPLPWNGSDISINGGTLGAPWQKKQRSASLGETGNGGRSRGSFLAARNGSSGASGPSKLSGEIEADTSVDAASLAALESGIPPALVGIIPGDQDYINSKLYQRTLKAQKALEKERRKSAARGPKSFDQDLKLHARPSSQSFMSDSPSISSGGGKKRHSLGWFRSRSEIALPISVPVTPPLPSSATFTRNQRHSGPDLSSRHRPTSPSVPKDQYGSFAPARSRKPSNEEEVLAHRQRQQLVVFPPLPIPGLPQKQHSHSAPPTLFSQDTTPRSQLTPTPNGRSTPTSNGTVTPPKAPSDLSNSFVAAATVPLPPSPRADEFPSSRNSLNASRSVSPHGPMEDRPKRASSPLKPTGPPPASQRQEESVRGREVERSPSSSEESPSSPTTPRATTHGPSFPPGAALPTGHTVYQQSAPRKSKSSLNMFFSRGRRGSETEQAGQYRMRAVSGSTTSTTATSPPPPTKRNAITKPKKEGTSFFGRAKKTFLAASEPSPPPTNLSQRPLQATVARPPISPPPPLPLPRPPLQALPPPPSPSTAKLSKEKPAKGSFFGTFSRPRTQSSSTPPAPSVSKVLPPPPTPSPSSTMPGQRPGREQPPPRKASLPQGSEEWKVANGTANGSARPIDNLSNFPPRQQHVDTLSNFPPKPHVDNLSNFPPRPVHTLSNFPPKQDERPVDTLSNFPPRNATAYA